MKLVVDEKIAYCREAFGEFGDCIFTDGRKISNEMLKDVDILIIRSITKVNKDLLDGTKIKFVGTTVTGTDHIDVEYINNENIAFSHAPGCNSTSVAEYVLSGLVYLANKNNFKLKDKVLGVVGVGNIGSKVVKIGNALGMKVLQNDPPLQKINKRNNYADLDEILQADIITLHIPLTMEGEYKTYHLLSENNLNKIRKDAILINTSRGSVVDNFALKKFLKQNSEIQAIFDVWENEPHIDTELLNYISIATAHIAGHSFEGKVNGTKMIYNSLCKFLNKDNLWKIKLPAVKNKIISIDDSNSLENILLKIFSIVYPILKDDEKLRAIKNISHEKHAAYFHKVRNECYIRRELENYFLKINDNFIFEDELINLGFNLMKK